MRDKSVSNRGRPWVGVLAIGALAVGLCLYGATADEGQVTSKLVRATSPTGDTALGARPTTVKESTPTAVAAPGVDPDGTQVLKAKAVRGDAGADRPMVVRKLKEINKTEVLPIPEGTPMYGGDRAGCGGNIVYDNMLGVAGHFRPGAGTPMADDMELVVDPVDRLLICYDIYVYVAAEGVPCNIGSDLYYDDGAGCVGNLVPGTHCDFLMDAEGGYTVTCEPTTPVPLLEDLVWMVLTFDQEAAGWVLTGAAEVGFTEDSFGLYDDPAYPDVWSCGWWFSGDPYAGFGATIVCYDAEPECGNGIEEPGEECDPGGPGGDPAPDDEACPGRCIAAGEAGECTCAPCVMPECVGTAEGETTCYDEYDDTYNAGCNSTTPSFNGPTVVCDGDKICGESGTFSYGGVPYRDTDWYEIEITAAGTTTLSWSVEGEFNEQASIIHPGSGDCTDYGMLDTDTAVPCDPAVAVAHVTAGTYWLFASVEQGTTATCGTDAEYEAFATCTPCTPVPPNDNCEDVTAVPLLEPPLELTFLGDNTCATNDCPSFPGGHVWEAFILDECADVVLDYCGTTPEFGNAWLNLAIGCPCADFTDAAVYDTTSCGGTRDENITMTWSQLPPGTYYYPVLLDPDNDAEGAYQIHVKKGDDCPTGACCIPGRSCSCEVENAWECSEDLGWYAGDDTECDVEKPNAPGEFFARCDCEPDDTCDYTQWEPGGVKEIIIDSGVDPNLPLLIPDGDPDNPAVSTVVLDTSCGPFYDLDVDVDITHPWVGDLVIKLRHVGTDTTVTLSSNNGAAGDNYTGTIFDDEALTPISMGEPPYTGRFKPDQPLQQVDWIGADPEHGKCGTWELIVEDHGDQDVGTLDSWSLHFSNEPPDKPDCQPNGFLDSCDIAYGFSQDIYDDDGYLNPDGVPDECNMCVRQCQAGSDPEGEVDCYDYYDDTYNGGCPEVGPAVTSPIACGQTICGTSGNYHVVVWHCDGGDNDGLLCDGAGDPFCTPGGGECINVCTTDAHCGGGNICVTATGECLVRDRDWYEVQTTEWMTMTWTVEGEFNMITGRVGMSEYGSGQCADSTGFIDPALIIGPCVQGTSEVPMPPGTHWWYAAAQYDSDTECGSLYNVTLECEPITCPDTCDDAEVIEELPFVTTRPSTACTDYYYEDCRIDDYLDYPGAPDAVYKYTPSGDVVVDIRMCGSGFTANVYVYENTCPPPVLDPTEPTNTEHACAVYPGDCSGDSYQAVIYDVPLTLTRGNTYYIVVDGATSSQHGEYTLTITRQYGECDFGENAGATDSSVNSTQWDPVYPFFTECADDFMFESEEPDQQCKITDIHATLGNWNHGGCTQGGDSGCTDSPADWTSILVTIYANNAGPPPEPDGQPTYPNPDGTHMGPGVLYAVELLPGSYDWALRTLEPDFATIYDVFMDVSSFDILLDKNTTYWLAVAPVISFSNYYQTGWVPSAQGWGSAGMQGFVEVDPPVEFWTSTDTDFAFVIFGTPHEDLGCLSQPDPDLWCVANSSGTGLCHRDYCDPQDGGADANGCVCVDIIYGDVYPVPGGDGAAEGFDILCILDAANNDPGFGCLDDLATGLMAGDIYPCGTGDGAVEGFDILAVLDAANQIYWCPDTCVCP